MRSRIPGGSRWQECGTGNLTRGVSCSTHTCRGGSSVHRSGQLSQPAASSSSQAGSSCQSPWPSLGPGEMPPPPATTTAPTGQRKGPAQQKQSVGHPVDGRPWQDFLPRFQEAFEAVCENHHNCTMTRSAHHSARVSGRPLGLLSAWLLLDATAAEHKDRRFLQDALDLETRTAGRNHLSSLVDAPLLALEREKLSDQVSETRTDLCLPELHTNPRETSTRAPGLAIEYASRRRFSMQLQTSLMIPFMFTLWHTPCMFTVCVPRCLAKDPSVSQRPLVSTISAISQVVSSRRASLLCGTPGSRHRSDSGTSKAITLRGAPGTQSRRFFTPMEWHQNLTSSRSRSSWHGAQLSACRGCSCDYILESALGSATAC